MQKYKTARNKHGTYCVPTSSIHRPAAKKILAGNVHEPGTIDFIAKSCSGGDIVHAGAYFGDFLPALSAACDDDREVWAFEPNPDNFFCASGTVHGNDLRNVNMKHGGLGDQEGIFPLLAIDETGKALGGGSRIIEDVSKIGIHRYYKVHIVLLDDILPENRPISIIHLDIEGYEWQALKGAARTIKQHKPTLVLESNPGAEWSVEDVLNLGYDIVKCVHSNIIFTKKE